MPAGSGRPGGFDTAIDDRAVQHYTVLQYVPEPETLHRGVRRLESGCYARIRPGRQPEITRYFVPRFAAVPIARGTEQARYDEITAVLEDSVAKHMRADVTVGAFLSGGIDSTAIAALAIRHNPRLITFTTGFEREGFSEIDVAVASAEAIGARHIAKVVSPASSSPPCPRSSGTSTSRWPTRRWCRCSSSPARPASTSRWCCPARAPTSCSAATRFTGNRCR